MMTIDATLTDPSSTSNVLIGEASAAIPLRPQLSFGSPSTLSSVSRRLRQWVRLLWLDIVGSGRGRRLIDVLVALGGLVACAPVLLLAALGIKLTSPGSVIYRQRRVG